MHALIVSVLLLAGCAPRATTPVPVSGRVFYKGTPLQSGLIVFTPDATRGESGPIATSEIRPDGSFALKSENGVGAAPGWYRVTVASLVNASSSLDAPPVSLIPDRYRDPELSQLQVEVKANLVGTHDFNLLD